MELDLVPVPPTDVERAKAFYERFVPLTPSLVERRPEPRPTGDDG